MLAENKASEVVSRPFRVQQTLEMLNIAFAQYRWLAPCRYWPVSISSSYGLDVPESDILPAWRVDVLVPDPTGREDWMHEGKFVFGSWAYRLFFLEDGSTLLKTRTGRKKLYTAAAFQECLGDICDLLWKKEGIPYGG